MSTTKKKTTGKAKGSATTKVGKNANLKIAENVEKNGKGNKETESFLYTGRSPEELEQQWLELISKLISKKASVPTEDRYTENLTKLYNGLHKELCLRCKQIFDPVFKENIDDNYSSSDIKNEQTPRADQTEKKLEESLTEKSTEINKLNEEIERLNSDFKRCKEELQSQANFKNENIKLNQEINDLKRKQKEIENHQNVKERSSNEDDISLQTRLKNQETQLSLRNERIRQLEENNSSLSKQVEELDKSKKESESKRLSLQKDSDKYKVELEKEIAKIKYLEGQKNELQQKLVIMKQDQKDLTQKDQEMNSEQINLLTEENKRLKIDANKFEQTINELKEGIKKLQNDITVLKAEKNEYQQIMEQIQTQLEEEKNKLKKELEEEKNKLKKEKKSATKGPDQKLKDLQDENDKLRDRLSQIAGSKLTDGNPAIADLGDPNRPTQLGEKFSELYDNEWTDAMEALDKAGDEKANIITLRTIVEKSYEFGKTRAAEYVKGLEEALLRISNSIQVTPDISKLIKDHRKNMALIVADSLFKTFLSSHTEYNIGGDVVKKFINKAVTLCWLMAIQDPPVILTTKMSGKFDTDRFRHYTKSGPTVDYVVWPVVFLHEGGPIICKGVAQGK